MQLLKELPLINGGQYELLQTMFFIVTGWGNG